MHRALELIAKLRSLDHGERGLLLESWFELLRVAVLLRLPLRARLFEPWAGSRTPGPEGLDPERVAYLVCAAASHHLKRMTCLEKSLALQRVLARRGLRFPLRIGVCREGGILNAHAWLEGISALSSGTDGAFGVLHPAGRGQQPQEHAAGPRPAGLDQDRS